MDQVSNRIRNYIRNIPDAVFVTTCRPGEPTQVVLNTVLAAKSWTITVVSGAGTDSSGTANNYAATIQAWWNKVMTY